ncbi:MAG: hypothetical protein AAF267_18555, partial [Deinococcota bacterium]
ERLFDAETSGAGIADDAIRLGLGLTRRRIRMMDAEPVLQKICLSSERFAAVFADKYEVSFVREFEEPVASVTSGPMAEKRLTKLNGLLTFVADAVQTLLFRRIPGHCVYVSVVSAPAHVNVHELLILPTDQ